MTMTTTDLAATFETTPRELRKFLRSNDSGFESVGKGSRYALPSGKRDLNSMKKRFDAWTKAKTEKAAPAPEVEVEEIIDEVETDFDSLENPLDA